MQGVKDLAEFLSLSTDKFCTLKLIVITLTTTYQ